jgi:hypothetical protein
LSKSKTHATFAPTKARNYKGASDHSKGSNNKENYSGGIAHFKGFHSKQLANFIRQLSKKKGKVGLVSAELKPSHERGEYPMEGPQKGDATRRSCFCTFSTRVSRDELPTPEVRRDFLYEISAHKLRLFDSLIFSWEGVTPNEAGLRTGGKFAQFKRRYPDWGSAKERKLKQDRARTSRKVSRISLRA